MKIIKTSLLIFGIISILVLSTFLITNVFNDDLYGRLIETKDYSEKSFDSDLPTITLVLKEYIEEKNSIESSMIIDYERTSIFEKYQSDKIEFVVLLSDRYHYNPPGYNIQFKAKDSIDRLTYGYLVSGFESKNFTFPTVPSINGYPLDQIKLLPNIHLNVNGRSSEFNFQVQKRMSGRLLQIDNENRGEIILKRSTTEVALIFTISAIFILLTIAITFGLFTRKKGLTSVEELILVAGYILAIAGFREILGINRNFGTGILEIFVILIPLLAISSGLVYSYLNEKISKNNYR